MPLVLRVFFAVLTAYTAALLVTELNTSQDFVRHYFSDIEDGRPFFAVNTTLSTFLLLGSALLLVFAATCERDGGRAPPAAWRLAWGQAVLFAFLAFDDRFQLHEALAYRLDIADHYVMACWAALELAVLAAFARLRVVPLRSGLLFAAATGCFVLMMGFDALVPHAMPMRLSIEDLAKSWAAALYFASAWYFARYHLGADPHAITLRDALDRFGPRRLRQPLAPTKGAAIR